MEFSGLYKSVSSFQLPQSSSILFTQSIVSILSKPALLSVYLSFYTYICMHACMHVCIYVCIHPSLKCGNFKIKVMHRTKRLFHEGEQIAAQASRQRLLHQREVGLDCIILRLQHSLRPSTREP